MADIVVSSKRKINIFDRVIQSVVIMVNMAKMNRAIDEHLQSIYKCERDDQREYQENILREIVFVKYQYDIMQREMYELRLSYPDEIIDNINSTDKMERLELQKSFLEMEYDRITKTKFKTREDIKYSLLIISSTIDKVKQNIKDEGKNKRYNDVIKVAEKIDTMIQTEEYTDDMYKELFENVSEYVDYINDNYDISKLPTDEREIIEFVIETMIKGIESDLDRHMYEFNLMINICKSSYIYFKVIDKIFLKLQKIYDESLEKDVITLKDYRRMYKDIYDKKIKTMVNDVHRNIKTEDEYLEYSKMVANSEYDDLDQFILNRAYETTENTFVKESLRNELGIEEVEIEVEKKEDKKVKKAKEDSKEKTQRRKVTSKKEKKTKEVKEKVKKIKKEKESK